MLLGVVLLNIVTVIEPLSNFGSRYHSDHQAKILYRLGVTGPPVTSQVNTKRAWRDVLRQQINPLNINLYLLGAEEQVGALYPAPPADLWPGSLMEKAVS